MSTILITRDQFREGVFKRDNHQCVVCKAPAKDAHHILERRLFDDGGYYLDNGASVCEQHHLEAEMTTLSCETLRDLIGVKTIVLPPHLYKDSQYDKWGNPVLQNGQRLKGELFNDESVQKILKQGGVLDVFTNYVKYPRTYHLPWSPGVTEDDRVSETTRNFEQKEVVVTLKMDGENTSMYNDYIHARSVDSKNHPSRSWVKNLHSNIMHHIPEGWRVNVENVYAKHSIMYNNLKSYAYGFAIWNEKNVCLSWKETLEWFQLLDIEPVPILYQGIYDENLIKKLFKPTHDGNVCEGYVLRLVDSFHYRDFRTSVAKYVRKDHVQTHGHWMRSELVLNKLTEE